MADIVLGEGVSSRERLSRLLPWFLPLLVILLLPVVLAKIPPLFDYPNHLAHAYVVAFGRETPELARFYDVKWALISNLGLDIVVPPLAHVFGIFAAGKIFLLMALTMLATGSMAIHYGLFRQHSVGPVVAGLFVYNQVTVLGLLNYLFSVGLALWGIAAWIGLRQHHAAYRGLIALLFVGTLFFFHMAALGIYAIAIFSYEMWLAWSRPRGSRWVLADLAALFLPFVLLLGLILSSRGGGEIIPTPFIWSLRWKLEGLWFILLTYWRLLDLAFGVVVVAAALWMWRRGMMRLHPAAWFFLAGGVAAYLVMPLWMMHSWGADLRLPIAELFVLIGFISWKFETPRVRRAFLLGVLALAALRVAVIETYWQRFAGVIDEFERSATLIEPGSKVLVARTHRFIRPMSVWVQLPCIVTIERSSLCSLLWADPLQQIVAVKEPYREFVGWSEEDPMYLEDLLSPPRQLAAAQARIYWTHWAEDYDYLYLLMTEDDPNPLPDRLRLVHQGAGFQLYRIEHRPG
jgi:hypothetical protein